MRALKSRTLQIVSFAGTPEDIYNIWWALEATFDSPNALQAVHTGPLCVGHVPLPVMHT